MSSRRRASQPDHAERRSPRQLGTFAQTYPHIARWVRGYGWIEWGDDLFPLERRSCIRALDEGGLVWAGEGFDDVRLFASIQLSSLLMVTGRHGEAKPLLRAAEDLALLGATTGDASDPAARAQLEAFAALAAAGGAAGAGPAPGRVSSSRAATAGSGLARAERSPATAAGAAGRRPPAARVRAPARPAA
jgi:hypothetical protein